MLHYLLVHCDGHIYNHSLTLIPGINNIITSYLILIIHLSPGRDKTTSTLNNNTMYINNNITLNHLFYCDGGIVSNNIVPSKFSTV